MYQEKFDDQRDNPVNNPNIYNVEGDNSVNNPNIYDVEGDNPVNNPNIYNVEGDNPVNNPNIYNVEGDNSVNNPNIYNVEGDNSVNNPNFSYYFYIVKNYVRYNKHYFVFISLGNLSITLVCNIYFFFYSNWPSSNTFLK
jgi:hypothetical protein